MGKRCLPKNSFEGANLRATRKRDSTETGQVAAFPRRGASSPQPLDSFFPRLSRPQPLDTFFPRRVESPIAHQEKIKRTLKFLRDSFYSLEYLRVLISSCFGSGVSNACFPVEPIAVIVRQERREIGFDEFNICLLFFP